jgi:hypothetical protein
MEFDTPISDTPYVYQPLDDAKQEIRLLHIRQHTGGGIQCDLTTVSLKTLPDYVCLSYTWGFSTPLHRIGVNDGHLAIRENLYHFLTQYSHSQHSYIWIDQISINQSHIHERNQQVGLMSHVFQHAAHVVVWLGNDARIAHASENLVRTDMATRRKAMATLLCNEYFTRLWVVQEFLLAREVRIMVRRDVWIQWGDMHYLAQMYRRCGWDGVPDTAVSLFLRADIRKPYELETCIKRFSGQHCQDPRDRVYGLLGLVTNAAQYRISIDYEKVYSRFVL